MTERISKSDSTTTANVKGNTAKTRQSDNDEVAALLHDLRGKKHRLRYLARRVLPLAEERGNIGVAHYTSIYIPVCLLICALIEALSLLWSPISIILYSVLFLAILITAYSYSITTLSRVVRKNTATPALVVALQVVRVLAFVIVYGELSRHLYMLFGGYNAHGIGFWHWLRYGVTQSLDTALDGVISAYGWHVSDIDATAVWSRTLLLLFNVCFLVWVLAVALTMSRSYRLSRRRARHTQRRTQRTVSALPQATPQSPWFWLSGVFLVIGYAPLLMVLDVIVQDRELWPEMVCIMALAYAALLFGMWLTWCSIQLLRVIGVPWTAGLCRLFAGILLFLSGVVGAVLIHWRLL